METLSQTRKRLLRDAGAAHQAGQVGQAIQLYQKLLLIDPKHYGATNALAILLARQGSMQRALQLFQRATELEPGSADAWNNLANTHAFLVQTDAALASYRRAIEIHPRHADALDNYGKLLVLTHQYTEAEIILRRAVAVLPSSHLVWTRLGDVYLALKRSDEADKAFEMALHLNPSHLPALAGRFWLATQSCRWDDREALGASIIKASGQASAYTTPFTYLHIADDPELHLRAAQFHNRRLSLGEPFQRQFRRATERIRVGYLSTDFRVHPVSYLISETIELHNRDEFEIIGFSAGPDDGSAFRRRLENAFDTFHDLADAGAAELASFIHKNDVDILVDLNGHTAMTRIHSLSLRPAPIQISWLGYPATSGSPFIDYAFVDRFLVPPGSERYFTESLAFLPDTFQPNDRKRPISEEPITRAGYGLPDGRFVFCSFNRWEKIGLEVFDAWLEILARTPNSVLWLRGDSGELIQNVRARAVAGGIDAERLIFCENEDYPKYLARYRLADLSLDPWPFNGGTTSSDALWMEVPVLTLAGRSMTSRMTGSFLTALGVPSLITTTKQDYVDLALKLATTPELYHSIKTAIETGVRVSPFFNAARFCRNIESAYKEMRRQLLDGGSPQTFSVGND